MTNLEKGFWSLFVFFIALILTAADWLAPTFSTAGSLAGQAVIFFIGVGIIGIILFEG